MTRHRRLLFAPALIVALGLTLAACSGAAAPVSSSPDASAPAESPATGSAGPAEPGGSGDLDPGAGAGNGSQPGEGSGEPVDGGPGGPGMNPGQPQVVVPKPGQQMVHPVAVSELVAQVDGKRVMLNARFWSGIEPCAILDSVDVQRDGNTFTVALNEGTSDPDAICAMLALEKVVVIDLGELASGTYTVKADLGDAPAIQVVVP